MTQDEINKAFDEEYIKYRDAFPKDYDIPALAQTQEPLIGCVNHDCDKCQAQKACVYCGQLVAKEKNT